MKEYTVGICDSEIEYATNLMDYINYGFGTHTDDKHVRAVAFSGMKAVSDYLSVSDLDLILTDNISECDINNDGYQYRDIPVIRLTDARYDSVYAENSSDIYKYQNVKFIREKISTFLKPATSAVLPYRSACVYSPLGRCGKTNFAKALAAVSDNGRSLYVGMEEFASEAEVISSDILYLLVTDSENLREELLSRIISDSGISVLYASGAYLDIRSVFKSDMEKLQNVIRDLEMYSGQIFDFGSAVLQDMSILDIFDVIYMPVLRDAVSERKMENFRSLLKAQGLRRLDRKIVEVEPPDTEWFSPAMRGYAEGVIRNAG